jgi:pyruvate/2-oxoglutarate/acetoin dehydrogenase E1 component
LVSGGYRGYGATHSQSLESLFLGVPGLRVIALSRRHNAVSLLKAAVLDPNPVIFVENKILYTQKPLASPPPGFRCVPLDPGPAAEYPPLMFTSTDPGQPAEITIVTYGGMTGMVEEVMTSLLVEQEVDCDYFVLTDLSAEYIHPVVDSVSRTKRLIVVEEGYVLLGIGAGIVAKVAEALPKCEFQVRRVGAKAVPIPPARQLETAVLPSAGSIEAAILEIID